VSGAGIEGRQLQLSSRRWRPRAPDVAISENERWSLYGAQRSQLVATGGKSDGADNGSNKRKPGVGELVHPGAAHVRDEAQVVVLLPLPRAAREPIADRAVLGAATRRGERAGNRLRAARYLCNSPTRITSREGSPMPYYKVEQVDPSQSALIVVDMQNDFLAVGAPLEVEDGRAMIPQLKRTIDFCRELGIPVIYTAHVHRRDGSDLGLFKFNEAIARGDALSEGEPGAAIYPDIAPRPDELVIKKHRFSAFYGTDLELVLRGLGVDTVIICGATTENCCHATARDAMFRDFKVIFLSDATATFDYADVGQGALSADEVHRSTLVILSQSTADVMTADEFFARVRAEEPVRILSDSTVA
jgi:ureidoacrylate peracid hydrolase